MLEGAGESDLYYPPEVRGGKYWWGGGIPVEIFPSCQHMKTIQL